jgi:hypothetical protein
MFLKWFKKIVDPMIGKTVIRFTTHGCQAQIHEFDYIGKIIEPAYPLKDKTKKFYKVEVLKCGSTEKRDKNLPFDFIEVASWYLQKLDENIFVAYD